MNWLGFLAITVPYAVVIGMLCIWTIKRLKPKSKRPKLRLIKGYRYYEDKRGPHDKSR